MEPTCTIKPMAANDIAACASIAAFAPDPWRTEDFTAELENTGRYPLVAVKSDGSITGFACFSLLNTEAELRMMAVDPVCRKNGIGRLLLAFGIRQLTRAGAAQILLEVRAGNTPALLLYQSMDFTPLARRKNMYSCPQEDGFIFCRKL